MNKDTQWRLVANGDWLNGQVFPLQPHTVLGRDSECDIIIPGTHLSRKHAEIAISGNKLLVKDLGSSNGTYVNGKQITSTELSPGDQIQFDVLTFVVEGPSNRDDINATMIRSAVTTKDLNKVAEKTVPASKKKWKTKPTSPGNRSENNHYSPSHKIKNTLLNGLGFIAVLAVIAGVILLLQEL